MRFGEYLAAKSYVPLHTIEQAVSAQRYRKDRLGRILVELDALTESDLDRALHGYFTAQKVSPFSDLETLPPLSITVSAECLADGAILLRQGEPGEVIALMSRMSDAKVKQIEAATNAKVSVRLVSAEVISLLGRRAANDAGLKAPSVQFSRGDDASLKTGGAYVGLYRDAVESAHKQKASDIHFTPTEGGIDVIYRVFGVMRKPWVSLGIEHRQSLINELKRLANMSIAVSGTTQDSRVSYPSMNLELRASLAPTHYGEKIVMRLLDQSKTFSLENLALEQEAGSDFHAALQSKSGVVLISGPTGSGKTTTLYGAVASLDRARLNVVTIEDPVEYTLPGITQMGVSSKMSFASALRAVLRQDPDVILVGEIRDEETADLCFKAASTGHLVLSTIHANSSAEVVQRLLGLGVERHLIATCLRFSAAQRVVGKLCPVCSQPAAGADGPNRITGPGCDQCNEGLVGLVPIFEYMDKEDIAAFAANGFSEAVRPKVSLGESLDAKARLGLVDAREVA